jgi:hypothetical protein
MLVGVRHLLRRGPSTKSGNAVDRKILTSATLDGTTPHQPSSRAVVHLAAGTSKRNYAIQPIKICLELGANQRLVKDSEC